MVKSAVRAKPSTANIARENASAQQISSLRQTLKQTCPELTDRQLSKRVVEKIAGYDVLDIFAAFERPDLKKIIGEKLVEELNNTAVQWRDERANRLVDVLGKKEVIELINRCHEEDANWLMLPLIESSNNRFLGTASSYGWKGHQLEEKAVDDVARILNSDRVFACFGAYEKSIRGPLIMQFVNNIFGFEKGRREKLTSEMLSALEDSGVVANINKFADAEMGGSWSVINNLMLSLGSFTDSKVFSDAIKTFDIDRWGVYGASCMSFEFVAMCQQKKLERGKILAQLNILKEPIITRLVSKERGTDLAHAATYAMKAANMFNSLEKTFEVLKLYSANKKVLESIESFTGTDLCSIIKHNLGEVCKSKKGVTFSIAYVNSQGIFPKPTLKNIKNYEKLVLDHLKGKYGLNKELTFGELLMISKLGKSKMLRTIHMINQAQEYNVKRYSISAGKQLNLNLGKNEIAEHVVISLLGSKDRQREAKSIGIISEIVEAEVINRARNALNARHRGLKNSIFAEVRQSQSEPGIYSKVHNMLREAQDENVQDVLDVINYNDISIKSDNLLVAAEDTSPLAYDSRTQLACVFLPRGDDILKYLSDKRAVVVRYSVGGKGIGAAICSQENNIFLVDSLEGHRVFRKDAFFDNTYQDLLDRAKDRNAMMVLFGEEGLGKTAQAFVTYLKKKGLREVVVDFDIKAKGYFETKKGSRALALELRS